MMKDY